MTVWKCLHTVPPLFQSVANLLQDDHVLLKTNSDGKKKKKKTHVVVLQDIKVTGG